MAVICREHGILFLANPRTGSTSVAKVLVDSGLGAYLPTESDVINLGLAKNHHANIRMLINAGLLQRREVDRMLKFTGIRNPFDQVASEYQKLRNYVANDQVPPWIRPKPEKLERLDFVRHGHNFDEYVVHFFSKGKNRAPNARWVDQTNRFYRFENLQADVREILREAGVTEPPVFPPFNVTSGKQHYRSYYSDTSREIVERIFSSDLERFGYQF